MIFIIDYVNMLFREPVEQVSTIRRYQPKPGETIVDGEFSEYFLPRREMFYGISFPTVSSIINFNQLS